MQCLHLYYKLMSHHILHLVYYKKTILFMHSYPVQLIACIFVKCKNFNVVF